MKKSSMLTIAGVMMLLTALVLSCTPPTKEEPAGELDAVRDVSYSGSTVSSKTEALDTTVYSLRALSSVLGQAAIPTGRTGTLSATPDILSKSPKGMTLTGLPEYLAAGFNGTVRFSTDNSYTGQDGSSASMNYSLALTTSHDLPLTQEPVLDLMNMDGDDNPTTNPDTKLPQRIYDYLTSSSPSYPYSITEQNGNNLSAAFNMQSNATVNNAHGAAVVDNTTVNLTINKAVLKVTANLNASASGVGFELTQASNQDPVVPNVTSGTLNLASGYDVSFLMVVSSDNDKVKGGKLLITSTFNKSITNINLVTLFSAIKNGSFNEGIEGLFGDPTSVTVTVKVYDNTNTLVYEATLTLAELMNKLQS